MPPPTDRQHLRTLVERRIAELHALLVLSRAYYADRRATHERLLAKLPEFDAGALRRLHDDLARDVKGLADDLGATRDYSVYVELVAKMAAADGLAVYWAKWRLKRLFRDYDARVPPAALLPEHTQLQLDPRGVTARGVLLEVRIIEAAMFEDMCAQFNRAWELTPLARRPGAPAPLVKECAAARRASVTAAFYVVEAYLNSLAFDYLIARVDDPLPDDPARVRDLNLLEEWDSKTGRPRYVSFRNKLLHYPRIVLGLPRPRFPEDSGDEVKYVLGKAKAFRDAVVHAGPRPDVAAPDDTKEALFWRLGAIRSGSGPDRRRAVPVGGVRLTGLPAVGGAVRPRSAAGPLGATCRAVRGTASARPPGSGRPTSRGGAVCYTVY